MFAQQASACEPTDVGATAAALLTARDFAALDAKAHLYLGKDRFTPAGNMKLEFFYDALSTPRPACISEGKSPARCVEREEALTAWMAARPASTAARIAPCTVYDR